MPKGGPNPMSPIARFASRRDFLKRKAQELATKCGVDVAVFCSAPGGGAGYPDYWPSREGVAAVAKRYAALPPEQREKHAEDRAGTAAGRLAEEGEKLTRAREGGVAAAVGSWDGSLEGVPADQLRGLLGAIDRSLAAARGRFLKRQQQQQQQQQRPGGAAVYDARTPPGAAHVDDEATAENSVPVAGKRASNGARRRRDKVDSGGGSAVVALPVGKNPSSPNAAAPLVADEVAPANSATGEAAAEDSVTGEDQCDEVQALGDADADDAEWMRDLVKALNEILRRCNAAPYGPGVEVEYINVGGFMMEYDAYCFIRYDIGMPPPCLIPDSPEPDDDGEPLQLWSWDNTMPPPP